MGVMNPRIDAYIAKSAEFAQPILERVRAVVHEACPDVEEAIKWGSPSFLYAGGILCSMAAFKQHASFGFWKHSLVIGAGVERDGMGSYGKLGGVSDLPAKKQLIADIKKAMRLNEEGIKAAAVRKPAPKPPVEVPADLAAAMQKNARARATFEAFSPSARREYVEWLTEAKREETRQKRLLQAIEWMAEGKERHWKYKNC